MVNVNNIEVNDSLSKKQQHKLIINSFNYYGRTCSTHRRDKTFSLKTTRERGHLLILVLKWVLMKWDIRV